MNYRSSIVKKLIAGLTVADVGDDFVSGRSATKVKLLLDELAYGCYYCSKTIATKKQKKKAQVFN